MKNISLSLLLLFTLIFSTNLPTAEAAETELSFKAKKELITKYALKYNIPPEILKAIAMKETAMMQYEANGEPVMNKNNDGGIGIMQVTMSKEEMQAQGIDEYKLKYNTEYNIEQGAKILNSKWNYDIPKINDRDRTKIEHWYFAVWAYNGLSVRNVPSETNPSPYQEKVFDYIRDWAYVPIAPTPKIETSTTSNGTLVFTKKQYDIEEWNTTSMQSLKSGDVVYTSYSTLANGVSNLRDLPDTVSPSKIISKVLPYSRAKIISGPYESEAKANLFSFYKVSVNGKEGYLSSSNLQYSTPEITIPKTTLPTNHREPIGRVVIRTDNVPYLKSNADGSFTIIERKTKNHNFAPKEMIRLYGVMGDYFHVGNGYYIKNSDIDMDIMIGRVYIEKPTKLYRLTSDNKLSEHPSNITYKTGEYLRVYDYDDQYIYVGSDSVGKHVLKRDNNVKLVMGFITPKKNITMYKPNGAVHKTLKAGERVWVYGINGKHLDVGGGYYVKYDNEEVVNYSSL
ncbi:transglycosylase SLT domain-containing protein [Metabacillus litoralis]|uniref:transglycosylase SLT domain-containing protein n=1 Tax=Metabacillus litoralis TaxID=152268 RepID=UPI00204157EF|nr:transglycosylase SLT domain-containing protein [Metabacillus litoralis]MCM3162587.1 transglycosylase SLT domain-containing protein [Metabacillus litoralis]